MESFPSRRFAIVLSLVCACVAEARADVRVVNHDNQPILVSAGYHLPSGLVEIGGWHRILPGTSELVYVGDESQVMLSVNNEGSSVVRHINQNFGVRNYWAAGDRFLATELGGPANVIRFQFGPGLERLYFKDNNNGPPPGWFLRQYYIVPNNVDQSFVP